MKFKAKGMIEKFKTKFAYEKCYSDMGYQGIAVWGCCAGRYPNYNGKTDCKFCPYHVEVKNE